MSGQTKFIAVRCPRCGVVIEHVAAETMVYCIACRKWCREVEEARQAAVNAPLARKPRRRLRCH